MSLAFVLLFIFQIGTYETPSRAIVTIDISEVYNCEVFVTVALFLRNEDIEQGNKPKEQGIYVSTEERVLIHVPRS